MCVVDACGYEGCLWYMSVRACDMGVLCVSVLECMVQVRRVLCECVCVCGTGVPVCGCLGGSCAGCMYGASLSSCDLRQMGLHVEGVGVHGESNDD